jgi:Zn-dependent protease with chaperone function
MSSASDVAGLPTPLGPRDRESFFRAQQRNRRATWRMSMFAALAALIMGIPLTLVITPLFYVATLVIAQIINYFSPLSPEFWDTVHQLARLALGVGDYFINHKPMDPQALALGLALALIPGMVIALGLWLGMMALFRRGGVGGALASLKAREPNHHDLKELQLANVVEEMAIAAGLPPPRVMLVDSPGANAGVMGTSPADARMVVSRRLLDDLNRDELQGVMGHLVASIGNGDLRIAFAVTTVFETGGLLLTIINSPFGPQARSTLGRIVRYAFSRPVSDAARAAEAETVAALLTRNLDAGENDDIDRLLDQSPNKSLWRKFLTFVFFPLVFTNLAIKLTLWFFSFVLLGPCMALLWRTRRYLADASAVQLTRYPDGLASALRTLSTDNTAIPGGSWAAHLFVINPKGDTSLGRLQPTPSQMRRVMQAWEAAGQAGAAPVGGAQVAATTPSGQVGSDEYACFHAEIVNAERAAMHGDVRAIARLGAFAKMMSGGQPGVISAQMPDPADIAAAQRGDWAAVARLQALNQQGRSETKKESGGLQSESMMSFHPALKRRLKRLARMGAHISLGAPQKKSPAAILVLLIFSLIMAPLILVLVSMMLVLIAMMIMLNLMFLGMWLAAIQALFTLLAHH